MDIFKELLAKNVLPAEHQVYVPDDKDLAAIAQLREELYAMRQWNFGASPRFSVQKRRCVENCGTLEFYMDIAHGKLQELSALATILGQVHRRAGQPAYWLRVAARGHS